MQSSGGGVHRSDPGLTRRGAATRARIVDSAAHRMHRRGVAATALDDVLADSGTSKSQLYHYFDSKEDLTAAVIGRQTELVIGGQAELLRTVDSLAGLRRWADTIVTLQHEQVGMGGCPLGSLASELVDSSDTARSLLREAFHRWEDEIRAALDAIVRTGELPRRAPTGDLAAVLLAALQGGLLLTRTTGDTRHLELALSAAIDRVAQE